MKSRPPRLLVALLLSAVTGLGACGGQEGTEISPQAAKILGSDVDAVEAAARAGDAAKLQQALTALREHVDAQQRSGDLSSARASQILAAGARVALDVGVPPPVVVVSPSPVPAPRTETRRTENGKGDDDDKEDEDEEEKEEKKKDD